MNNNVKLAFIMASVIIAPRVVHGDDTNPIAHPIIAYDEHKVKENTKEVHQDATKLTETNQSVKDQKDFMDQRRTEYEKALKDNGSESDITRTALAKYKEAEKKYNASVRKHHHVMHEMHEDQRDLNHAKHELNKDTDPTN